METRFMYLHASDGVLKFRGRVVADERKKNEVGEVTNQTKTGVILTIAYQEDSNLFGLSIKSRKDEHTRKIGRAVANGRRLVALENEEHPNEGIAGPIISGRLYKAAGFDSAVSMLAEIDQFARKNKMRKRP